MCLATPSASAERLVKPGTSLEFIPADVSFYGAVFNLGELAERVRSSRAYDRLIHHPFWNRLPEVLEPELYSQLEQVKSYLANPQVQAVLELLTDMHAQEVFVAGDRELIPLAELNALSNALSGLWDYEEPGADRLEQIFTIRFFARHREKIRIPRILVGWKVKDTQRASRYLMALQGFLTFASLSIPELAGRLNQETIAGARYQTITLDGRMLPWDDLEWQIQDLKAALGEDAVLLDQIIEHLEQLKLVIAFGMRDDYVMLSLGPDTSFLARLGQGPLLADQPAMARLAEFADQIWISTRYISRELLELSYYSPRVFDLAVVEVNESFGKLPEGMEEYQELIDYLRTGFIPLVEKMRPALPVVGPSVSCNYLTPRGVEEWQFDWHETPVPENRTLRLLDHFGGKPLLGSAGYIPITSTEYDLLLALADYVAGVIDHVVERSLKDAEDLRDPGEPSRLQQYRRFKKRCRSILADLDRVNRRLLLPALEMGQWGLVVDARMRTVPSFLSAEECPDGLPHPEVALVIGLSDAGKFREAIAQYQKLWDQLKEVIREGFDDDIFPFEDLNLRPTSCEESAFGTILYWNLPAEISEEFKLDPRVGVTFAIGSDVAVLCLTVDHAKRLLESTPLQPAGVIADPETPRLGATTADLHGISQVLEPWVLFSVRALVQRPPLASEPSEQESASKDFENFAVQVLKTFGCLKRYTSENSGQPGLVISHSLLEVTDLTESE